MKIKKICIIFLLIFGLIFTNVKAITEDAKKAISETAYAYLRQGGQLQYDSGRKTLAATPEDATSKTTLYTVCSGFVYQTYYQTFGIKLPEISADILELAKSKISDKNYVIAYYDTQDKIYSNDLLGSYESLVADWKSKGTLETGDIIVVMDKGGSAHAAIVLEKSDGLYVIESSQGHSYNYAKHIDSYEATEKTEIDSLKESKQLIEYFGGTVATKTLTHKLYIYKWYQSDCNKGNSDSCEKMIQELAIIRPAYNNLEITDAAKTRVAYPSIDIEKIIKNRNDQQFAYLGDELTYEIKIHNGSSQSYKNLKVVEEIDSDLKITNQGSGKLSSLGNGNKQLEWTISLEPGKDITLQYTVKIPLNKDLLGKIIFSKGKVGNISTSKIDTLVRYNLNSAEISKLKETFNTSNDQSTGTKFINNLYLTALNLDLGIGDLDKTTNMMTLLLKYNSSINRGGSNVLSVLHTELLNKEISKHILHNFYGLRLGASVNSANNIVKYNNWNSQATVFINDRVRTLTKEMLMDGDIILSYMQTSETNETFVNKSYIYLNSKLYRKTAASGYEEISGDELTVFLRNLVGRYYVVLRPIVKKVVGIQLELEKTKFYQNTSEIDLSNSKMLVTYTDETTNTVALTDKNVKISGFDSSEVGKNTLTLEYDGYKTTFEIDIIKPETPKNPATGIGIGTSILMIISSISFIMFLILRKKSKFLKHN